MTLPILKAIGAKRPVGMLHIDAHCDTSGPYEGTRFHHGGPFREAVLAGVLDPKRVIQIGIRGNAEYLWEFSYETGMTVIHAEEFHRIGVEETIRRARAVLGDGRLMFPSISTVSILPMPPAPARRRLAGSPRARPWPCCAARPGSMLSAGDVVEVAP